ncbi:MAG: hypothetical protein K0R27_3210 [Xanthobacteraceae bacterium]|jgi:hypothetical protein|nr:hypothetical protein [Xanthobacteraceae bacterium]
MFEVVPSQIEALESKQLVQLLGRLLHAEAQRAGLALAGISVPLQITVADGGEDGRIKWEGGLASTDYLLSRANHFQCKASKIGAAGWKKECWVKSTQRKGKVKQLTPLLADLVAASGGSYIGFTTEALTSQKVDDCVAAIKAGITEASGDPASLAAIDVYDANRIAGWASHHPAVGIWLAELAHGQPLSGFETVVGWGRRSDFIATPHVVDTEARFQLGTTKGVDAAGADNKIPAETMRLRIMEHVSRPRASVRVIGPSGLGKSRFMYEALRSTSDQLSSILASSAVFADYRVVAGTLLGVATHLAGTGQRILLIVDECPRETALDLVRIATAEASGLSVITIDTDVRPLDGTDVLHITATQSEGALIQALIKRKHPTIKAEVLARLSELCGGFPRFAVLLAEAPDFNPSEFHTVDDIVDRILCGANMLGAEERRALEALSLFEDVDFDASNGVSGLDHVAKIIARMDGDEMFEHLAKAQQHDLVGRRRTRMAAQPLPVALNLALRRLKLLRPSTLWRFMAEQDAQLVLSMLRRWRYFDRNVLAVEPARRLLQTGGRLSEPSTMLTPTEAELIDALVHIVPDQVALRLEHDLLSNELDASTITGETRRNLVHALEKLVFRADSFGTAARILLKLAASETENYVNNATGIFKQLFQLELGGTEAPPSERFRILDDAIESGDEAVLAVCVDALSNAFNQFPLRFGNADEIGSGAPLKEWLPQATDDYDDFYRQALDRLVSLRSSHSSLAPTVESVMTSATRFMLSSPQYREYGERLTAIAGEKGWWPEAVESVGDWLYFDRAGYPKQQQAYVRELYDRLFPSNAIDKAILFTQFWSADIRDPDTVYTQSESDFGYSERAARVLASEIASDELLAIEAVQRMGRMDLKNVVPFAEQLAMDIGNKLAVFDAALDLLNDQAPNQGVAMIRGLLRGIDRSDQQLADECLTRAKQLMGERPWVDLYTSLSIDEYRLAQAIEDVRWGRITPSHAVLLSYGQGLNGLSETQVAMLLEVLAKQGRDGVWAALEVSMMYKYGEQFGAVHAQSIVTLLVHPSLLESGTGRERNAHVLESSIQSVRRMIGVDGDFADGLCVQLRRFVKSEDGDLLRSLMEAMRMIVTFLREDAPDQLWSEIATLHDSATPVERNRLAQVVGSTPNPYDGKLRSGPGPLFGLDEDMVFVWADEDEDRIGLLVTFYPLLDDEDVHAWHPAFLRLAERYGSTKTFQAALERRIHPRSWSGSLVPMLEAYQKPIEAWFGHPHRRLASWAKDQHKKIQRRIESENAYAAERGW